MSDDRSSPWGKRPKREDAKPSREGAKPSRSNSRPPRDESSPAETRSSKGSGVNPWAQARVGQDNSAEPAHEEKSSERPARNDKPAEKRARKPVDSKPVHDKAGHDKPRPDKAGRDKPSHNKDAKPARTPAPLSDDNFVDEGGEAYPKADRANEYRIYGVNACMTAFRRRKEDIIRGYFSQGIAGKFGETMRFLAQQKKAYRVVENEELEKVTQSAHHGGVCFLMKKRPPTPLDELLKQVADKESVCLLVLEGVGNPHNLGAILRSCAHFDVPAVLVDNVNILQSGAAARVAEGGLEWVELVQYGDLPSLLEQLRQAGFSVLSTSSHQGRDLYRTELPARVALFLGDEGRGLHVDTLQASDLCIRIPGTARIESLNVGQATGILLGEYWRQRHAISRVKATQPTPGRLKLKKNTGPKDA